MGQTYTAVLWQFLLYTGFQLAGAMRIPKKNRHYLTDAYIDKFKLETKAFYNIDPQKNCFVSIRGRTVRIHDFQSNKEKHWVRAKAFCDHLWTGWDEKIKKNHLKEKYKINHIVDYYKRTIEEVSKSAPKYEKNAEKYAHDWRKWLERWSKMSFTEFLSSDLKCSESSDCKEMLRPWPKIAIDCITDIDYIASPQESVATVLAEEIGQWWDPEMKTLTNGMEALPEAFVKDVADPYCLENDIHYGITVRKIKWKKPGDDECYSVKVFGRQTQTKNEVDCFEADAVIVTVPLNVMRQVEFDPRLPQHVSDAIGGIHYEPSTKIFLGFRERFWEEGEYPIVDGGISKTNLPISQIVYPGRSSKETPDEKSKRGVLLLYTWNREALLFGSQPEDETITEALREVTTVYKHLLCEDKSKSKVEDSFEAGAVQSWYTDPSAQGAFVHLLPYSYMHHIRILLEPTEIRPIFFGGEAISFANGWIQGALESGLRAAWQFYKFNEEMHSDPSLGPLQPNGSPGPDFDSNHPFFGLSRYPFSI